MSEYVSRTVGLLVASIVSWRTVINIVTLCTCDTVYLMSAPSSNKSLLLVVFFGSNACNTSALELISMKTAATKTKCSTQNSAHLLCSACSPKLVH